jgi:hypothetical protein
MQATSVKLVLVVEKSVFVTPIFNASDFEALAEG